MSGSLSQLRSCLWFSLWSQGSGIESCIELLFSARSQPLSPLPAAPTACVHALSLTNKVLKIKNFFKVMAHCFSNSMNLNKGSLKEFILSLRILLSEGCRICQKKKVLPVNLNKLSITNANCIYIQSRGKIR